MSAHSSKVSVEAFKNKSRIYIRHDGRLYTFKLYVLPAKGKYTSPYVTGYITQNSDQFLALNFNEIDKLCSFFNNLGTLISSLGTEHVIYVSRDDEKSRRLSVQPLPSTGEFVIIQQRKQEVNKLYVSDRIRKQFSTFINTMREAMLTFVDIEQSLADDDETFELDEPILNA